MVARNRIHEQFLRNRTMQFIKGQRAFIMRPEDIRREHQEAKRQLERDEKIGIWTVVVIVGVIGSLFVLDAVLQ